MKNWIIKTFFPTIEKKLSTLNVQLSTLKEQNEILEGNCQANEQMIEQQRRLVIKIQKQRNVSWPKPAVRMPAAAVLAEFNVPLDQGLPLALHQELDDQIQELLDLVSQPPGPTLTADQRLHLAGGIEHLRLFQKQLLDLSHRASTTDEGLENDEKQDS